MLTQGVHRNETIITDICPVCASDRSLFRPCHAHARGISGVRPNLYSNTHADLNIHPHSCTHTHPNSYPNSDSDTNTHAHSYPHSHANTNIHPHSNTNTHANANTLAHTHPGPVDLGRLRRQHGAPHHLSRQCAIGFRPPS